MPQGLKNATLTFHRFMDDIIRGVEFCVHDIDDVLVFSLTTNVQVNVLLESETTFLGHTVSSKTYNRKR